MPSNLSKTLYSLIVRTSVFRGESGIIGNFEELAENLSLSIAYDGPNELTFEITTRDKTIGELGNLFQSLLARDVLVDSGNRIWRGYVNQLMLSAGTQARRISSADIINEVEASHTGGVANITVPALTVESQLRFGRRVLQQTDSADLVLADATLQAEEAITANAFGQVQMVGRDKKVRLRVQAVGYIAMLDWCTTTLVAGETIKQALERIITDCGQGVITFGADTIQDNGQTWNTAITDTGLKLIRRLERVLDVNGDLWRFYIDTNNVAHWEPIDFTPQYVIRQGISDVSAGVYTGYQGRHRIQPFEARAGVIIRDSLYPIEETAPGSPFQSGQDGYVRFVKFDARGNASFESGDLIDFGTTDTYGT